MKNFSLQNTFYFLLIYSIEFWTQSNFFIRLFRRIEEQIGFMQWGPNHSVIHIGLNDDITKSIIYATIKNGFDTLSLVINFNLFFFFNSQGFFNLNNQVKSWIVTHYDHTLKVTKK